MRESDIIAPVSYIARIEIEESKGMRKSSIRCSHGTNSVIGPSGSGKTLLLDAIKRKITGTPLGEDNSSKANYERLCDIEHVHLYDSEGNEITTDSGYQIFEGANLYQKVLKAYSSDEKELLEYLGLEVEASALESVAAKFQVRFNEYIKNLFEHKRTLEEMTKAISRARSSLDFIKKNDDLCNTAIFYNVNQKVEASKMRVNKKIDEITQDKIKANESLKILLEIANKNNFEQSIKDEIVNLKSLYLGKLGKIKSTLTSELKEINFKKSKQEKIYETVQKYNPYVSKRSEAVNEKKQDYDSCLQSVALSALKLKQINISKAAPVLTEREIKNSIKLNSQSASTCLIFENIDLTLRNGDDIVKAFPNAVGCAPRINKSKFKPPYDLSQSSDVEMLAKVFYEGNFNELITFSISKESVVDCKIQLKNKEGNFVPVEEQSAGMLSQIYISQFLDRDIKEMGSNTIVLYDQPETNMEKVFLHDELVDKFDKLRKTHQLFVATHEPLLVVNADSNEIVLASNKKLIRCPNEISYENRTFVGANVKGELVDEIAKLIDGGPEAVKKRSSIYEGMVS